MGAEEAGTPAGPVVIYTDGGADPNPGVGGWAAIIRPAGGPEQVLTGGEPQTTNNRMEITAALRALEALPGPAQVELHTDSQYLRKGITEWLPAWQRRGWKTAAGKPVQNEDLWRALWPLVQRHDIRWHWVAGHRGEPLNERVDALARAARLAISPVDEAAADRPRLYLRAACRGNPGPGAWAAVLEGPDDGGGQETRQFSGTEPRTTNNRMELMAAVEGLRQLPAGSAVEVVTTSDYLHQGATRWLPGWRAAGWRKKDGEPVANADLWQALDGPLRRVEARWMSAKGQAMRGLEEAGRLLAEAMRG
jgi:ribonuclease HI